MPTKITDLAEYTTISTGSFVPVVDNNETVNSKNKKISIEELRKYYFTRNNTSSFTKHTPGFYYFGDNSDGPGNFSGSITTLRTRISASFNSTQDGPPVIKNFSSLFVSRSVVIKPTNRCRGMLIFVDGDAIISGSISMTARGAKLTGSDASFQVVNPPYLGDYWTSIVFPSSSYLSRVFSTGASGGAAASNGTAGTNGRSGGGGGGGPGGFANAGAGAAGTGFSGGAGGGGGAYAQPAAGSGYAYGGQGGNGSNNGGNGAGNPGGTNPSAGTASNGTGGLLILIVRGNLKIGPNGSIISNGSSGGNASGGEGGGGGSGGGVVYVYYGGNLTNNGTVNSNGGAGGLGYTPGPYSPGRDGGTGGAGTLVLSKLNTAFPIAN